MATYINDLRLKEISTGDESGTWGTSTNTNLELIGEALGYATQEVFGSDADATTTIADGASDPARAMYFKITSAGSLTATRTCTIAPNTVSRVMFIENATTGSQSIAISQGSGANVTIATGKTAVVYLDGAGSGAAVVDAMAGVDPGVTDTLAEVLVAGNTTGGTNIELSTTDKVQFRDTGIYINSSVDGQLDIVADTEIQIAATTVDLNGNLDVSGTALVTGVLTTTAATVFNGGFASNADSTLGTDKKVQFRDSAIYINSSADGQLDIVADTEIQIAATTIDINGAINASGEIIAASLDISGDIDVDGTTNLDVVDIDGAVDMASTLTVGSTLTVAGSLADWSVDSQGVIMNFARNSANYIKAGTTGGYLVFQTNGATAALTLDTSQNATIAGGLTVQGAATFNETGNDSDFRVESDTLTHALFVDGASGYVGINDSSPGAQLDLNTSSGLMTILNSTHTNGGYVRFEKSEVVYGDLGNGAQIVSGGATTAFGMNTRGTGDLLLATNGVTRASLQDGGAFTTTPAAGGHAVFNEDGVDADFRVESDTNTNALFVQGSDGNVGIGLTPTEHLHVGGRANAVLELQSSTTTGTGRVNFNDGANSGQILYSHTDNTMDFYSGGSYAMRLSNTGITAPQGIYLGGTGAANKLEDYEEGTWDPEYTPSSGSFTTITYDGQTGHYVKVGALVTAWCYIRTASLDTTGASGSLLVTGFPFTANADSAVGTGSCSAQDQWTTQMPTITWVGATTATLAYDSATSYSSIPISNMTTGVSKNRLYAVWSYETTS